MDALDLMLDHRLGTQRMKHSLLRKAEEDFLRSHFLLRGRKGLCQMEKIQAQHPRIQCIQGTGRRSGWIRMGRVEKMKLKREVEAR